MNKNVVFIIGAVCFFALTALLLAILPWAGYTLLIISCLFTIVYEFKYANHQIKFFNNLRKQGALFEISGFRVGEENKMTKVKIVGFHNKILLYDSNFKSYYNFKDVTKFVLQPKTSVAYGGFTLKFAEEEPLKVLCLSPEKISKLFETYYEQEIKPFLQFPAEYLNEKPQIKETNSFDLPSFYGEIFDGEEVEDSIAEESVKFGIDIEIDKSKENTKEEVTESELLQSKQNDKEVAEEKDVKTDTNV